jgi:hypothetical protein
VSNITLSLISHTNVGKTTLARTLLRKDVGDALDQAHVTDANISYELLRTSDGILTLWDTPGFGDTARLLKRLKISEQPLGWIVRQVWDRITDRPLWCSQQAVINVREEADVVLYLVNAAEDPESAGYVDLEMEVLQWIGKPVILLLNQTGAPRGPEFDAAEEKRWRDHLEKYDVLKSVIGLDAFARCWVQENELLREVTSVLPKEQQPLARSFDKAWQKQNLTVFDQSIDALLTQLAQSAADSVEVSPETLLQKLWIGRGKLNLEMREARKTLSTRLAERTRETTNLLIELHGIEGVTKKQFSDSTRENFEQPKRVDESLWSAIGGFAVGATGGLAADLAHGGLTFGGGALLGGLGGGAGAYFLAKGLNLTRGADHRVYWTLQHFRQQVLLATLSYLAVAHFGRGRGQWKDGEHPQIWQSEAEAAITDKALEKAWKLGTEGATQEVLRNHMEKVLRSALVEVLSKLYPEAAVEFA